MLPPPRVRQRIVSHPRHKNIPTDEAPARPFLLPPPESRHPMPCPHARLLTRLWPRPFSASRLVINHYYKNACSECMHVITIVIPVSYQHWVSFESLQYGILLLHQTSAYMTLACLVLLSVVLCAHTDHNAYHEAHNHQREQHSYRVWRFSRA